MITVDTTGIARNLCRYLADKGVVFFPTTPTSGYPEKPPHPPAFLKRLPAKYPTAVAVSVYGIQLHPDPNTPTATAMVQVRCRATPTADTIADRVLSVLHGTHYAPDESNPIRRVMHVSTAVLGQDDAGLDERSDNYQVSLALDSTP